MAQGQWPKALSQNGHGLFVCSFVRSIVWCLVLFGVFVCVAWGCLVFVCVAWCCLVFVCVAWGCLVFVCVAWCCLVFVWCCLVLIGVAWCCLVLCGVCGSLCVVCCGCVGVCWCVLVCVCVGVCVLCWCVLVCVGLCWCVLVCVGLVLLFVCLFFSFFFRFCFVLFCFGFGLVAWVRAAPMAFSQSPPCHEQGPQKQDDDANASLQHHPSSSLNKELPNFNLFQTQDRRWSPSLHRKTSHAGVCLLSRTLLYPRPKGPEPHQQHQEQQRHTQHDTSTILSKNISNTSHQQRVSK